MGSTGAPPVVFRAPAEDSASGYDGGVHLSETGGGGASRGARGGRAPQSMGSQLRVLRQRQLRYDMGFTGCSNAILASW